MITYCVNKLRCYSTVSVDTVFANEITIIILILSYEYIITFMEFECLLLLLLLNIQKVFTAW